MGLLNVLGVKKVTDKLFDHSSPSEILPVLSVEHSSNREFSRTFMLDDNYVGYCWVANPLTYFDETTIASLESILSMDIPYHSYLQVGMFSSPDMREFLEKMLFDRNVDEAFMKSDLSYSSVKEQAAFIENAAETPIFENFMARDFNVIFSLKMPFKKGYPTDELLEEYKHLSNEFESALKNIGFSYYRLDGAGYKAIMETLLNWDDNARWKTGDSLDYDPNQYIREQLFDPGVKLKVEPEGLKLGDKYVKMHSIKQWPSYVSLGLVSNIISNIGRGGKGISGNYFLNLNVYFPETEKFKQGFEKKRSALNYQSFSGSAKWVPRLELQKNGSDILGNFMDEGEKPLKAYLSIATFTNSKKESRKQSSSIRTYLNELGFKIVDDKFAVVPFFLNSLPLGADNNALNFLRRYHSMAAPHVANLMPIVSEWKGTARNTIPVFARSGQVIGFDFFDSTNNYNAIIAAASGAGKSFLTNYIITNYLANKAKVWMIDVGRSYEKLCNALGGEFLVFDGNSDINLSPFKGVGSFEEEYETICMIILLMISPRGKLDEYQETFVKALIQRLWQENGEKTTVTMIANNLLEHDELRIKDMGAQLYTYTEDGPDGKWFHGEGGIDIKNSFTLLELEELKGRGNLQQVVLLSLITKVSSEMYLGDRGVQKIMLIDEAWDLLGIGSDTGSSTYIAKFIETGFRRFRKYGGSGVVITQSINDLYQNATGIAIAENASITIMLKQKSETIDMLKRSGKKTISDGMFELMKTIHTVPGEYSEFLIEFDGSYGIGRLIVDRFSQLLYTTKADELSMIARVKEENNCSVAEAIKLIVKSEGKGIEEDYIDEDNYANG